MMANHLLGSGGSSRLWKRIREREGLSYNVYSGVSWNPLGAQLPVDGRRDLRPAEPGQGRGRVPGGARPGA